MSRLFILISGKAGVGKTTFANILLSKLNDANSFSIVHPFAKGVKDTATYMGWDVQKDSKGRKLLQGIGMIGREYDESLWVKRMLDTIPAYLDAEDIIICDDWRFENEYKYLESLNNKVFRVRISAPSREILKDTPEYSDISETSLPDDKNPYYYDTFINNDNITLDELSFIGEVLVNEVVMNFLKEES